MELIGLKVDLVVAAGGDVVAGSIIKASSLVPVVMTNAEDPVAAGFVVSLAHPGGNVTRLTTVTRDLSAERLEVLKAFFLSSLEYPYCGTWTLLVKAWSCARRRAQHTF